MADFTAMSLAEAANVRRDSPKAAGKLLWDEIFVTVPLARSVTEWGIPIRIGASKDPWSKSIVALGGGDAASLPRETSVSVGRKARYVLLLHFSVAETDKRGYPVDVLPGEQLAGYESTRKDHVPLDGPQPGRHRRRHGLSVVAVQARRPHLAPLRLPRHE